MSDLHKAVWSEDKERLVRLIREGADLKAVDGAGQTALCYAVSSNRTDMVRLLLESGANPSTPKTHDCFGKHDTSPLMIAAERGHSIVEMLLAAGVDVNYRSSCRSGHPDNFSALDLAVRRSHWPSARLLVEAGADMTPPSFVFGKAHDESPLMVAADAGGPSKLVELMLVKGADPNYVSTKSYLFGDQDWTALHAASGKAATGTIRVLCEWGADVNAVSRTAPARTPLHMAATGENISPEAVSTLVVAGADPFGLDAEGRTVVEAMVNRRDAWTMEVLLDSRPSRF